MASHVSLTSAELFTCQKLNTCRVVSAGTGPKWIPLCRKKKKKIYLQLSYTHMIGYTLHCKYHCPPFIAKKKKKSLPVYYEYTVHCEREHSCFVEGSYLFRLYLREAGKHLRFFPPSKMWCSQKVLRSFLICRKILDFHVATTLYPTPKTAL